MKTYRVKYYDKEYGWQQTGLMTKKQAESEAKRLPHATAYEDDAEAFQVSCDKK